MAWTYPCRATTTPVAQAEKGAMARTTAESPQGEKDLVSLLSMRRPSRPPAQPQPCSCHPSRAGRPSSGLSPHLVHVAALPCAYAPRLVTMRYCPPGCRSGFPAGPSFTSAPAWPPPLTLTPAGAGLVGHGAVRLMMRETSKYLSSLMEPPWRYGIPFLICTCLRPRKQGLSSGGAKAADPAMRPAISATKKRGTPPSTRVPVKARSALSVLRFLLVDAVLESLTGL